MILYYYEESNLKLFFLDVNILTFSLLYPYRKKLDLIAYKFIRDIDVKK